ncbi:MULTISPECIES: hypothetical protein [Nocardiopsis]|uniref:Uncharacterized protein n=2 Tax=Nocardiopsis TaxID=2013 RepID=A0A840W8R4_9ACTN|nr:MULTISPECIES: hypothetical protein [Nocardiopsis]MBB5493450.1 hypothetical protein [Nocardiopsis metallicus]MCK9873063.1 hypothetical protein [Nocardiopsis dassonvillei]MEE2052069.1 hypothetical protein [Nocardiopsis umidischolae]
MRPSVSAPVFPLARVRRAFTALVGPPDPWRVEFATPEGPREVDLLRVAALVPHLPREISDALWREVIDRARGKGDDWAVVAVGLGFKPLRSVVDRLSRRRRFGARREELEAEVIAAWIQEVDRVDVAQPGVLGRLWAGAYRAGQRWRYAADRDLAQLTGLPSDAEAPLVGHPEEALIRAVQLGVITGTDAWLVGATRLERHSLKTAAAHLGMPYPTAKRRRQRAEAGLTVWLREEIRTGG